MMLFWYFNPNPNPDSLVKQGDSDRRDEVVLARKVLPRTISLDHPLYRRVAPRICSLARFSRPVPGVKRGSAPSPSLLASTSAPPSSSVKMATYVQTRTCISQALVF